MKGSDMDTTEDIVKRLFAEQMGLGDTAPDLEVGLKADYQMDSLDCIEFVMELENEFDIDISDEDAEKVDTLQQAIDYINEKYGAQRSAASAGL